MRNARRARRCNSPRTNSSSNSGCSFAMSVCSECAVPVQVTSGSRYVTVPLVCAVPILFPLLDPSCLPSPFASLPLSTVVPYRGPVLCCRVMGPLLPALSGTFEQHTRPYRPHTQTHTRGQQTRKKTSEKGKKERKKMCFDGFYCSITLCVAVDQTPSTRFLLSSK